MQAKKSTGATVNSHSNAKKIYEQKKTTSPEGTLYDDTTQESNNGDKNTTKKIRKQ
jgi:hypothetical protein